MIGPALVGGAFLALVLLERRFPLRARRERQRRRLSRNLAIAAAGAVTLRLLEQPAIVPLARMTAARGWGITPRLPLPPWARRLTAILLLDYTLYLWHVLTHRVPFLWRFHRIHHADLDLDASTALRFHFGELALSVPWRAAQVVIIGAAPATLYAWQVGLLLSVLFHHSNVALPEPIDRLLSRVLVTPRLHGIHHSRIAEEHNANWSSGLTMWDRLHGTLRTDVSQASITIGLREFPQWRDVGLAHMLALPLRRGETS